jgi:stage IV sporulation protein FB
MLIWAALTGRLYNLLICFLALISHEIGHIITIYLLKEKISIFYILPFGFSCRLKNQTRVSKKNMIKILVAGPAMSLIMAGIFFFWTKEVAMINLFIALLNLMPIGELDGGRLLNLF